jgi:hypothetical protein
MSDETKQTAVDWFVKQLQSNIDIRWRGTNIIELGEQAKEMEKEQIKDAWIDDRFPLDKDWVKQCAEQYYNETYGANK